MDSGSVSRVRMRLTPSRFAAHHEQHFSVIDLVANVSLGLPDHLSHIPSENQIDFLCALLYTILVDQTMYAHRQSDYEQFHSQTLFPKMDRTVGYARTLMMANPYELLEDDVLASRGFTRDQAERRFSEWAPFITADLRLFFTERSVGTTTWDNVRDSILRDPSATWGAAGASLAAALVAAHSAG